MTEEAPDNNIVPLPERRKAAEEGFKIHNRTGLSSDGRPKETLGITTGSGYKKAGGILQKAGDHAASALGVEETNSPTTVTRLFTRPMQSPRILIIDPDPVISNAIANTFTPHGFIPETDQSLRTRPGVNLPWEGDRAYDAIILREDEPEAVVKALKSLQYAIPVVVVSNNPKMSRVLDTQEIKAHLKAPVRVFALEGETLEGNAHLALLGQVRAVIAAAARESSKGRSR